MWLPSTMNHGYSHSSYIGPPSSCLASDSSHNRTDWLPSVRDNRITSLIIEKLPLNPLYFRATPLTLKSTNGISPNLPCELVKLQNRFLHLRTKRFVLQLLVLFRGKKIPKGLIVIKLNSCYTY